MQKITAVMERAVCATPEMLPTARFHSKLPKKDRDAVLSECRRISDGTFLGLDLTREILSIEANGFGDTIWLGAEHALTGFACCHQGAGSEAGSSQTLVKFAAVSLGGDAQGDFEKLMLACEKFATTRGVKRLVAGTNTGRAACYEALLGLGFWSGMNGIATLKPAADTGVDGYNVPGIFAVDDWR